MAGALDGWTLLTARTPYAVAQGHPNGHTPDAVPGAPGQAVATDRRHRTDEDRAMTHTRRIGVMTGVAALLLTATACSGLGRSTVGMLSFRGHDSPVEVSYSNTPVKGCHRIEVPHGATHVENNTLVDVVLYRTPDCSKGDREDGIYVATTLSNVTAPASLPWRSFRVIH